MQKLREEMMFLEVMGANKPSCSGLFCWFLCKFVPKNLLRNSGVVDLAQKIAAKPWWITHIFRFRRCLVASGGGVFFPNLYPIGDQIFCNLETWFDRRSSIITSIPKTSRKSLKRFSKLFKGGTRPWRSVGTSSVNLATKLEDAYVCTRIDR